MARAEIHIRRKTYSIACAPGQEDRLSALAGRLDQRVEAIAQAVGDVGEERLFLIAALSMLDELDAAPGRGGAPDGPSATTASEQQAAAALIDAAARIEAIAQRAEARRQGG
ncbi:MAG: cell division protein ZapA [Pseudomonadota bacterium]